jgi:hypothetical protein
MVLLNGGQIIEMVTRVQNERVLPATLTTNESYFSKADTNGAPNLITPHFLHI